MSISNLTGPILGGEARLCGKGSEMLTCGLSCLNALNALFAKLAAVVIGNGERKEIEGLHSRLIINLKIPAQPPSLTPCFADV